MSGSIQSLATAFAEAMGINQGAVNWTVERLQESDLLGAMDDIATSDDAVHLLIALAGNGELLHPAKIIERLADLPCISVTGQLFSETGEVQSVPVDPTNPVHAGLTRHRTLGATLAALFGEYATIEAAQARPGDIVLGSELGQPYANLSLLLPRTAEGHGAFVDLVFGNGENRPPDDDRPCRVRRLAIIPPAIFDVVRRVLGTNESQPVAVPGTAEDWLGAFFGTAP